MSSITIGGVFQPGTDKTIENLTCHEPWAWRRVDERFSLHLGYLVCTFGNLRESVLLPLDLRLLISGMT